MISLFASIIFVVLLVLIKQSMDKLHAIIVVIAFFIFVQFIILRQLIPLWQKLAQIFTQVPYSKGLLFTAFLLILSELICSLLDQLEYESFVTAVQLSIRIVLVSYWLTLLEPAFRTLVNLLERF
ncbi:MAG: pyruvate formate-lyase [Solibacillus sp.]|uniref:pyruvate formate-lyase n=1 Tax=unclassified Solibacillus TaxID=2637870 RepID=UPI0030F66D70